MESSRSSRSLGLLELPNEILSLILGRFCLHCRGGVTPQAFFPRPKQQRIRPLWSWYSQDCQSLHSACLVSTRLRDVAQPILYHQFSPGYGDSWLACRYQWTSRLLPFLCTVTRRLDLAAQVRHLHLNDHIIESLGNSERAEVEPTLEKVSRARGIQLSGFLRPFQDWWQRQSSTGRIEYRPGGLELAAMLLACLPNLACLSLSTPSPGLIPLSALRAANISSLPIQTLDFIYYGSSETVMGGIFEAASSNLRTLNLHSPDGADLRTLARPLPNLRDICITGSLLTGSDDLGFLLSHLRGIESFTYEAVYATSLDDFLPSNAVVELLKYGQTLKALHLNVRPPERDAPHGSKATQVTELMHGLSGFPVLQHLFLNTILLYGSEVEVVPDDADILTKLLPPSIVSLKLADRTAKHGPEIPAPLGRSLSHLAKAASQGQFRNLRSVRIDTNQPLDDYDLGPMLARSDVDFKQNAGLWRFTDQELI